MIGKIIKNWVTLFAILFLSQNIYAQIDSIVLPPLSRWKEYPMPYAHGIKEQRVVKEWDLPQRDSTDDKPKFYAQTFQVSENTYKVYVENDSVYAMLHKGYVERIPFLKDSIPFSEEKLGLAIGLHSVERQQYHVKKVHNGYLAGNNLGEFGGGLYWFSSNGEEHYEFGGKTSGIVEVQGKIFGIRSYRHIAFNDGCLFHIVQNSKEKWVIGKKIALPEAPSCFTIVDNAVYIVVDSGIVKFRPETSDCIYILSSIFSWRVLRPNTILFHENDIYISMIDGVLKISNVVEFAKNVERDGRSNHDAFWEARWFKPY